MNALIFQLYKVYFCDSFPILICWITETATIFNRQLRILQGHSFNYLKGLLKIK